MTVVTVEKACAWCTHLERLTAGMVGAEIEFQFSPDWNGLSKIAVFQGGDVTKDVLLPGAQCRIPWEVLTSPHKRVRAGVYGVNANGDVVLPTVYADIGIVFPAASPSDDPSADPTPELWAQAASLAGQALARSDQAAEDARALRESADAGAFNGSPGKNGDNGVSPIITASETEDGFSVTIQDAAGVKSLDLHNGKSSLISGATAQVDDTTGTPAVEVRLGGTEAERTFGFSFTGLRGKDGYTPVKGKDYLTETDIQEIAVAAAALVDVPAEYTGAYDVTPATAQQELETDGKRMAGNVTVQAIPYYEVSNPQNGKTIIIGA